MSGGNSTRPGARFYIALHTLHAQGFPVATIARQLGISRPTVYAYLRRTTPPGPKRPQFQWTARVLTPFVPYLIRRWRESGADSMKLWREIQARGDALEAWMAEATDSGIAEVARFARGLQDDLHAIQAGLTLEWSNGVTEGQVHRLKLVKRQGYGRAGFALLRQRVLHAA